MRHDHSVRPTPHPATATPRRPWTALAAALGTSLILSACGGGGGGGGADPLTRALADGDATRLSAADRPTLLRQAIEITGLERERQMSTLRALYGGDAVDTALDLGTNSSTVTPTDSLSALPVVVSDNGAVLAAVSRRGDGRALAYGAPVMEWMAGGTRQAQHLPLFRRAMDWLIRGEVGGTRPASLRVATAGHALASVKTVLTGMGITPVEKACDLADPANTCWTEVDLMVFGASVRHTEGLQALVARYLAAGKSVAYLHGSWVDSAGGRQVLAAAGMTLGGYPGNYFAPAAGVSVSSATTPSQLIARGDRLLPLLATLRQLEGPSLTHDFAADPAPLQAVTRVHEDLARRQAAGHSLFGDEASRLYALLVLWADLWRPEIVYGNGLAKEKDALAFLRAYASDSWLVFNRRHTTVSPQGQGDYMPKAAQSLAVSADDETLTLTLPQASGVTLVGRGAVPGKALHVELVEAPAGVTLAVQTSHLRAWGDPVEGYLRPRRPHSFSLPLPAGTTGLDFVTPFGGPLALRYAGATAGAKVVLRVRGTARYAHFDFTGEPDEAEISQAVAALRRADFGWQTAKFVGGEIQQTIGYALRAIGTRDPREYVVDRVKGIIFDTNHIANGYRNMPPAPKVASLCTALGWDCTGTVHAAPGVQHFVGWIATCGFLCSGNPSDGFTGIDVGWGWAHELGHNTVQRSMTMLPGGQGCTTECNNNILAAAQMLRKYALTGEDSNGDRTGHATLFEHVAANRASGLSGEAARADMQSRLWGGSDAAKLAFHFQLAYLYTRERHGLAQPTADTALEFFTLLTKGDRLVARQWSAATAARYGMGRFTSNTISNHELVYVLGSRIIGADLRELFVMYGLPVGETALASVADLGLPRAPRVFYALAAGKANQLATGRWLDLEGGTPAWPF